MKDTYATLFTPFENSEEGFLKIYFESLEKANNNKNDNFKKRYRFFSLWQLVQHSLKTSANFNFAECGCFKGQSSYIISSLLKTNNFKNNFFIFDSFEGLSEYNDVDRKLKNKTVTSVEENRRRKSFTSDFTKVSKLLDPFNFVKIYKSWIPSDFEKVKDIKFQFVHIDVDLYQPTYDSLEFFFPRLVDGGIIVCDDYNFSDFPGAKVAWDEYFKDKEHSFSYEVPLGSKFIIK